MQAKYRYRFTWQYVLVSYLLLQVSCLLTVLIMFSFISSSMLCACYCKLIPGINLKHSWSVPLLGYLILIWPKERWRECNLFITLIWGFFSRVPGLPRARNIFLLSHQRNFWLVNSKYYHVDITLNLVLMLIFSVAHDVSSWAWPRPESRQVSVFMESDVNSWIWGKEKE